MMIGLLFFLFFSYLHADELYIVESVPEETIYGSSFTLRPYDVWVEMIGSASRSLDFEEFYIDSKKGEPLAPIIEMVKEKSNNGVKVRMLFEKAMLKTTMKNLKLFKDSNVEIRIIDFKKFYGGVCHSKFFVVDEKEVFVGSQNFDWKSLKHIHELGVRIKSEKAAGDFLSIFNADWEFARTNQINQTIPVKTRISCSRMEKAFLNTKPVEYCLAFSPKSDLYDSEIDVIIKMIKKAKKRIYAQVMTYSDSHKFSEIKDALLDARKRGVDVRIVFSDWAVGGKRKEAPIKRLVENGIKVKISSIPDYSKGFIPYSRVEHLKYIVVDGKMFYISTSNWGYDYFYKTRGAGVLISGGIAGQIGEDIFNKVYNGPYAFDFNPEKEYEPRKKH